MNQRNSEIKRDMDYGQPVMILTTPNADMKQNIDCTLGSLKLALRRRRLPVSKFGQISIRYKRYSGASTEFAKILSGQTASQLYIFEFTDCWIICRCEDIKYCLSQQQFKVVKNHDNETEAAYIDLKDLSHLAISKKK